MTRTVVVVGVGPGLGSAVAREFAREGDRVALFARSEEYLTDLADRLRSDTPGDARAIPTDITDPDAVVSGFDTVRDAFGGVDILVFTAFSTGVEGGGITDTTAADLTHTWATRVLGAFRCATEVTDDMVHNGGGSIVFVNSGASVRPTGTLATTTARHAARGLIRSMSADPELGEAGVQSMHVIVDGWIDKLSLREKYPEYDQWMDPDDIAAVISDLASAPDTVHGSEIDLRHPSDDLSF